jgi:transposase
MIIYNYGRIKCKSTRKILHNLLKGINSIIKRRERLVSLVINESLPIIRASTHLGLKYSTAKLIVKRFRETGILYESKRAKS